MEGRATLQRYLRPIQDTITLWMLEIQEVERYIVCEFPSNNVKGFQAGKS